LLFIERTLSGDEQSNEQNNSQSSTGGRSIETSFSLFATFAIVSLVLLGQYFSCHPILLIPCNHTQNVERCKQQKKSFPLVYHHGDFPSNDDFAEGWLESFISSQRDSFRRCRQWSANLLILIIYLISLKTVSVTINSRGNNEEQRNAMGCREMGSRSFNFQKVLLR
jgi:hypothetical protein